MDKTFFLWSELQNLVSIFWWAIRPSSNDTITYFYIGPGNTMQGQKMETMFAQPHTHDNMFCMGRRKIKMEWACITSSIRVCFYFQNQWQGNIRFHAMNFMLVHQCALLYILALDCFHYDFSFLSFLLIKFSVMQ